MAQRGSVRGERNCFLVEPTFCERGSECLHVVQAFVVAILGYQAIVRAALYYFALMEHDDLVGMANGRKPVGNGDGGALLHEAFQCVLHESFRLRVEGGSGFVEDEDVRVFRSEKPDGPYKDCLTSMGIDAMYGKYILCRARAKLRRCAMEKRYEHLYNRRKYPWISSYIP